MKKINVILPAERSDRMARAVTRLAGFKSETLKILDCVIFLFTFDMLLITYNCLIKWVTARSGFIIFHITKELTHYI